MNNDLQIKCTVSNDRKVVQATVLAFDIIIFGKWKAKETSFTGDEIMTTASRA